MKDNNTENLLEQSANSGMQDENLIKTNLRNIPDSFDKYEINIPNPILERDDEILQRFHKK